MKTEALPVYLIVAAAGEFQPGLAIRLTFEMRRKNNFSHIAFICKSPLTLTKTELLRIFDRVRNLFVVDYADPREAFTGKIEVEALTGSEINAAIKFYHDYAGVVEFPPEYLANLETALQINSICDCIVACEKLY